MHQFQAFTPQAPTVAEYAFPSVLQFLQSEWRRFERDRNEWDIEKAEMKARIAFLEGEKRGVDNTKLDLMKRVKMLEFALRQERQVDINNKALNRMSTYSAFGNNMSQVSPTSATCLDPAGRAKSREFLRICLQEISYLTSSPSATAVTPDADSTQTNDIPEQETTDVAQRTIEEEEEGPTGLEAFQREEAVTVVHSPVSAEQWRADLQKAGQQIGQKSKGKKAEGNSEDEAQLSKDVQDKFNISPERLNKMVKEHFDTVRSIAFHPTHKSLLSGSEDGTMKYWNLEASLKESKRTLNGDVEPIHTYRGHTKAITAVAISADQDKCFSASMDSTVRSWKLVPMNKEAFSRLDPEIPMSSFIGHTDTVWDIRLFPLSISSSQLLASISADGALKIWDTETKGSPLRSSWGYNGLEPSEWAEPTEAYTSGLAKLPVPTGLDFCPTDLKKMVVSYSNSVIKLFDIETGKEILAFKSNDTYDGTSKTQINKIVCHPTMPVVVSGHEDRYIRFFDINSGACSFSMLAHLDSVSSLDIDPAGLVLCSGGHDASVRLWDIASSTRSCLQEFTAHRRKSDEGVTTVKYHPTLPGLMATGGADSIVKVYARS
ncbi:MAG: WD40-repeat-containing domain protein [Linnemannia elongata]|nr:MAG: WD40-repeat-containing domain protein [Linnemannia elongata]